MSEFETRAAAVVEYVTERKFESSYIRDTKLCLEQLGTYLEMNSLAYSSGTAQAWLDSMKDKVGNSRYDRMCKTVERLDDVYRLGHVDCSKVGERTVYRKWLSPALLNVLELFITEHFTGKSPTTASNNRLRGYQFFAYLQSNFGITEISEITYECLFSYFEANESRSSALRSQMVEFMTAFFQFLHEKDLCRLGFALFAHYYWNRTADTPAACWNMVSEDSMQRIRQISAAAELTSIDVFRDMSMQLEAELENSGYSHSGKIPYRRILDMFYLFLDANSLSYNIEIAKIWCAELERITGVTYCFSILSRPFKLLEEFMKSGSFDLNRAFRPSSSEFPEWCKDIASNFLQRIEISYKRSTWHMYRCCIMRFCQYLDGRGITDFSELTPSAVKDFNFQDLHETSAGKAAYNVRIRIFLRYLGEIHAVSNQFLCFALPNIAVTGEKIVEVLDDDEYAAVEAYADISSCDSTEISYRDKAVLLLGLKMGLRSIDITELKLDSINFDECSLQFTQRKTNVEVNLPMPVDVANALFLYLTKERPKSKSRYVFLKDKAPYGKFNRSVCERILKKALPDRDVPGSGFHVTRRTYATRQLKNGMGLTDISTLLGHAGITEVHRYLSLDDIRMKECSLTLDDLAVQWKGEFLE